MKIIIIKLGHLGDTLLMTPTLDFLAAEFPRSQIDVVVRRSCEFLLQGHPAVTHILPVAHPEKATRSFFGGLGIVLEFFVPS